MHVFDLVWHKLGVIYLDVRYFFCNSFINHIPCWTVRKALYQMCGMKMGKNCRIGYKSIVIFPERITLGEGCIINEYCHLDGRGGLSLGNNVSISIYSKLISASHDMCSDNFAYQDGPILINDYVWLGAGAIVLENSHLAKGCVVASGSVFKGCSEEMTVYGGVPARKIKKRDFTGSYSLKHECFFR